jgi:hypothetical protein
MNDAPKLEAVPELPGAVLLNQPQPEQPPIEELTFVDVTGLAYTRAKAYQADSESPSAKREYALAMTAIEDAVMRFNRARSIDLGIFHVTDTEDPQFLSYILQEGGEADGAEQ